jgi:hypothetical protein
MPNFPARKGRRSTRMMSKGRRASLVVNLGRKPKRLPCLVVDYSKEGFRLRGKSFRVIRLGQVVKLIFDGDTPPAPVRCRVIWVGKAGSKQGGQVGLETV